MALEHGGEVTSLLEKVRQGNEEAANLLIPIVYDELRRMAGAYMHRERQAHSLQATELVHEAYMRLVGSTPAQPQNRAHFFAIAAHSMRQVLMDHARKRGAGKRGSNGRRVELEDKLLVSNENLDDVIAIDEALEKLALIDPNQCRLIELRFFAGLSVEECAEVMGLSESTVKREWRSAKAWLHPALTDSKSE